MNMNIYELLEQKRILERYADELGEARSRLNIHKNRLESVWLSYEAEQIYDAIDRIIYQLEETADKMRRIGKDMNAAYEEICEEGKCEENNHDKH